MLSRMRATGACRERLRSLSKIGLLCRLTNTDVMNLRQKSNGVEKEYLGTSCKRTLSNVISWEASSACSELKGKAVGQLSPTAMSTLASIRSVDLTPALSPEPPPLSKWWVGRRNPWKRLLKYSKNRGVFSHVALDKMRFSVVIFSVWQPC